MADLRVRRDDLTRFEVAEGEPEKAAEDLAEGEIQLRIERFALTANNISYGLTGEALGYWSIFPTGDEEWGRIPAWGFARVAASRADGVPEGGLYSGLLPMGSWLTSRPEVNPSGFTDVIETRVAPSVVYNQYLPAEGDGNDYEIMLRPLFMTSVLLDLSLAETIDAGAQTAVLTSASSKTAFGLAHCLRERGGVRVVGLTSPARVEWVEGLGLYDEVRGYDEIDGVAPNGGDSFVVDFAGDRRILSAAHAALGHSLQRSVVVGATHWDAAAIEVEIPGVDPKFFFAPDEIVKHGASLAAVYSGHWATFEPLARRAITIDRVTTPERLTEVYSALVAGDANPAAGFIASL